MRAKTRIVYVTSSKFKSEENAAFVRVASLRDGTKVADAFEFEIRSHTIAERLEVDIETMVRAESAAAYASARVPCVVEHAGLVFEEFRDKHYPGGLTKPMWNALGDRFIEETHSANRRAIARAAVGYCDGMSVRLFVGETAGRLADAPRGQRDFYWDTVFIPDNSDGTPGDLTYAEIVEKNGLDFKMQHYSQSSKAMLAFLEIRRSEGPPKLWPDWG